MLAKKNHF